MYDTSNLAAFTEDDVISVLDDAGKISRLRDTQSGPACGPAGRRKNEAVLYGDAGLGRRCCFDQRR